MNHDHRLRRSAPEGRSTIKRYGACAFWLQIGDDLQLPGRRRKLARVHDGALPADEVAATPGSARWLPRATVDRRPTTSVRIRDPAGAPGPQGLERPPLRASRRSLIARRSPGPRGLWGRGV